MPWQQRKVLAVLVSGGSPTGVPLCHAGLTVNSCRSETSVHSRIDRRLISPMKMEVIVFEASRCLVGIEIETSGTEARSLPNTR